MKFKKRGHDAGAGEGKWIEMSFHTSLQAESEDEQEVTPEVAAGDSEPSESAASVLKPSVSTSSSGGSSHME